MVEVFGYESIYLVAPDGGLYQYTGGGTQEEMQKLEPVATDLPKSYIVYHDDGSATVSSTPITKDDL